MGEVCRKGTVAITLSRNASQPCNNYLDRQGFKQRVGFFFLVKANVKTHSCQVKGKSSSWNASEACNSKSVTAAYAFFNLESPLQTKSWFGEGRLSAMCLKQVSSLSAGKNLLYAVLCLSRMHSYVSFDQTATIWFVCSCSDSLLTSPPNLTLLWNVYLKSSLLPQKAAHHHKHHISPLKRCLAFDRFLWNVYEKLNWIPQLWDKSSASSSWKKKVLLRKLCHQICSNEHLHKCSSHVGNCLWKAQLFSIKNLLQTILRN